MALPDWLPTLQEANSVTRAATPASVDLSYLVPLHTSEVTTWYQQQLQKAGVRFMVGFDGIGDTISASTESISCIVHIVEADSGSRVRVGCVPEIARPSFQAVVPSNQFPAVAEKPGRAATTQPKNPTDIEGWSQARWGMTQQQVLRAFPGQAKILTGDILNRQFGTRGLATVGIDEADVGAIPVRVLFFFDGAGKLDGIRFVAKSASPSDDQFMRMEHALSSVYGAPTLRGAMGRSAFNSAWVSPNSVIQLSYVSTIMLNLSIDRRGQQTVESVRASWPGFADVHETHQVTGTPRQQSAGPEPIGPSWSVVKSWSGSGIKETESFPGSGREWRIIWRTRNETLRGAGILQIYVKNSTGSLVSVAANKQGEGEGVSYVHSPKGDYYLTINSASVDWSVVVEDRP